MDRSRSVEESRRAGRELAQKFNNGAQPQPINVRFNMQRDEFCVGEMPVVIHQMLEGGDGSYMKKSGGYIIGRSPGGMVVGGAFSAARFATNVIGNQARKSKAARDAAVQWRPVDNGRLYLTNRRFAIQGSTQWYDIWFEDVRVSDCNGQGIELQVSGSAPTSLEIARADYWFVMFNKLAYDRVVMPPGAPAPPPPAPRRATPKPPAPAPLAPAPRAVEPDDGSPTVITFPPPVLLGRWINLQHAAKTLELAPDGSFVLMLPDGAEQSGRFNAVDSTLTLEVSSSVKSIFTWSVVGNELTLKPESGLRSVYRRA